MRQTGILASTTALALVGTATAARLVRRAVLRAEDRGMAYAALALRQHETPGR